MANLFLNFYIKEIILALITLNLIFSTLLILISLTIIILCLLLYIFSNYILPLFKFSLRLTVCLTSFYSLKSKFNILISKVKSIILKVSLNTFYYRYSILNWLCLKVIPIKNIYSEFKCYILEGLTYFALSVFIGLGFIFLFKPVLFKYLFLLFLKLLYLIWYEIPANIILNVPGNIPAVGPGNGGPTPDGNNSLLPGILSYNENSYPGSEIQIKYWDKVMKYLGNVYINPIQKSTISLVNSYLNSVNLEAVQNNTISENCTSHLKGIHNTWPNQWSNPSCYSCHVKYDYWREGYNIFEEGQGIVKKLTRDMDTALNRTKAEIDNLTRTASLKYIGPKEHLHKIVQHNPFGNYWALSGFFTSEDTDRLNTINLYFIKYNWLAGNLGLTLESIGELENGLGIKFNNKGVEALLRRGDNLFQVASYGTPAEIEEYSSIFTKEQSGLKNIPIRWH